MQLKILNLLNLNSGLLRLFLNFVVVFTVILVVYFFLITNQIYSTNNNISSNSSIKAFNNYNVWLIFTKVTDKSPLKYKFHSLLRNLLNTSSVPLKFHIIVDNKSRPLVIEEIQSLSYTVFNNKSIYYELYDIEVCAKEIFDIVQVMKPHFSSKPGSYYSDSLFYISLGLYRIAPKDQDKAVLLDCDLYFKKDIALLFKEFENFKSTALFGLAPELSSVYRHVLHVYKSKHKTTFGEYYQPYKIIDSNNYTVHPRGFQGYNSGVVLLKLNAIAKSSKYKEILKNETIAELTKKYKFRGHLGDQDFYTLMGFDNPELIQTLNCGFNRQLCTWWKDHGYGDVFDFYFKCDHPIVVLHGNCNSKIPR